MVASLSIIVPLYNKTAFVRDMLQSLVPQLQAHDEILIVDDCSSDGSYEVIRDLIADNVRYHRLIVNSGPATARNRGAQLSGGQFLLFFDADDIAHPQMLQTVRAAIEAHPRQQLFTFGIGFQVGGDQALALRQHRIMAAPKCTLLAQDAFVEAAIAGRTLCTASSTCVSRGAFETEHGFVEGLRFCEDPELWARLSAKYPIVVIEELLAIYRHVPSSLSHGMRAIPGSVQKYVDTLLGLAATRGESYRALARSLVRKNTIFSRAAQVDRAAVIGYLRSTAPLFGHFECATLRLVVWLPSGIWRGLLGFHASLLRRRTSTRLGAGRGREVH